MLERTQSHLSLVRLSFLSFCLCATTPQVPVVNEGWLLVSSILRSDWWKFVSGRMLLLAATEAPCESLSCK